MPNPSPDRALHVLLALAALCAVVAFVDALAFTPLHFGVVGVASLVGTVAAWSALGRARAAGDPRLKMAATALVGFLGVPLVATAIFVTLLVLRTG